MKIVHERHKCIGCGSCVQLCPELFEMSEDGRASLKGEEVKRIKKRKEILKREREGCAPQAAEVCPVNCIHLK